MNRRIEADFTPETKVANNRIHLPRLPIHPRALTLAVIALAGTTAGVIAIDQFVVRPNSVSAASQGENFNSAHIVTDKPIDSDPTPVPTDVPDTEPSNHPSDNDRNTEPGNSGTQGKSPSNPDGNGVDKPYPADGQPPRSQGRNDNDGNNGCGNDNEFDDDANGCKKKDKETPTPVPPTPTVVDTPTSQPTETSTVVPSASPTGTRVPETPTLVRSATPEPTMTITPYAPYKTPESILTPSPVPTRPIEEILKDQPGLPRAGEYVPTQDQSSQNQKSTLELNLVNSLFGTGLITATAASLAMEEFLRRRAIAERKKR